MFNPQDLLKSVNSSNKEAYASHSKVSSNYVSSLSSINFKSDSIQNSTADYFRKAHSKMFIDNLAIFSKK
ncbi:MAG: hypothetical protein GKC53_01660 [Neisseriaceae bacterium]|nr:MAG: hypothetical protein GKC53_01660 [Neisseriaceae bacterium]